MAPFGTNRELLDNTINVDDVSIYPNPYAPSNPTAVHQHDEMIRLSFLRTAVQKRLLLSKLAEINNNKQLSTPASPEDMQMGPYLPLNHDLPESPAFLATPFGAGPIPPWSPSISPQPPFVSDSRSNPKPSLLLSPEMYQIYEPPIISFPMTDMTGLYPFNMPVQMKPPFGVIPAFHGLSPPPFPLNPPHTIPPMLRPLQMYPPHSEPYPLRQAWLPPSQMNIPNMWLMRRPTREPFVRPFISTSNGPYNFNMFPTKRFPYFPYYDAVPNRPFLHGLQHF